MFHLQPGTGLGFSGSREMALGLGGVSAIVVIVPGGGITDAVEYTTLRSRSRREREELEILILMVSVIEQDRDH